MQDSGEPAPFEKTEPLSGQECFLFTYVLLKEEKDGILGFFKFLSAHDDPEKCKQDFVRVEATNKQCIMKWGVSGEWEVIRRPETDTEGTIDIVHIPGDEEEFMGEKLTRETVANNPKGQEIMDRAAYRHGNVMAGRPRTAAQRRRNHRRRA